MFLSMFLAAGLSFIEGGIDPEEPDPYCNAPLPLEEDSASGMMSTFSLWN